MSRLDADSRIATHHTLTIDSQFRTQKLSEEDKKNCNCPIPDMRTLSEHLISMKGTTHPYFNGTIELSLEDICYFPFDSETPSTHLCLLINAVDKNGSITVIKNTVTKKRTEINPGTVKDQGYDMSSFAFISLDGSNRSYNTLLTVIPKVPTKTIELFINRVLFVLARKNEELFTCDSKTNVISPTTGKPVKVLYKPVIKLEGMLDQELFDKINKEGLSDVLLVKNEFKTINAPDIHNAIIPMESTLRIKPSDDKTGVMQWIKKIGKFFKEDNNGGYDTIKIKFREPDAKSPRQVSLSTDDIRLDAIEKTFIKKTIVTGFSEKLKDSYAIIHEDIIEKLNEIS